MTVLGISRDRIVSTCISKADVIPLRPLFANLRSAFAFVLSTSLTSAIFGFFIRNGSESKTWQMLGVVCQKIR